MCKWLMMSMVALAILAPVAQAERDITGPQDTVQGVPNDGVTTGGGDNGWPSGEVPRQACDDDITTKFLHFKGEVEPTGIRITPAVGETIVTGVTFTTANDHDERDPVKYELSGSNVGIDGPYTLIASGDIVDFAGATAWTRRTKTTTPMQFANTVAYKHYQLLFPTLRGPTTANSMQIAEIELLALILNAWAPNPPDGAAGVTTPLLQWTKSDTAVLHNVYLGSSPDLTEADLRASNGTALASIYYHVATTLEPGVTYYWRVDQIDVTGTVHAGAVWQFTMASKTAWAPKPADGGAYVAPDVVLSWSAGLDAATHDVYFSEDRAAVESGTPEALKSAKQYAASYTPSALERGKTYFWRVDEVLANGSIVAGPVWSFTVRPAMAKVDFSLVGWWKMEDAKSDLAVDYSGYDNYGALLGGPTFAEGYLGEALSFDGANDYVDCGSGESLANVESVSVAAWIRLNAINGDRKIAGNQSGSSGGYKLGIYSSNKAEFEIRNASNTATHNRDVAGGTALQPNVWYHIVGVYDKGMAIRTYVNGKPDREVPTSEVAAVSNGALILGREPYSSANWWFGLMDDVRVYNKVLTEAEIEDVMRGDLFLAWNPQPKPDAILDIRDADALMWSAGDTAARHDVYFGPDKDAVKVADASSPLCRGRQTGTSLSLNNLVEFGGGSYFWRVDEVEADATTLYKGNLWDFIVPAYLIVDDFESYTDYEGSLIYESWIDGLTNHNSGSMVGNWEAPFAERTIVHNGGQAMPFDYNNMDAPFYSEAEFTFVSAQDWTVYDVANLVLFVRASLPNDDLYVEVEDSAGRSAIVIHPNRASLVATAYTPWTIPLNSFTDVNLTKVKKIYIGVGDRKNPKAGGSGRLYIDDIRLTRP